MDAQGGATAANSAASTILGVSRAELLAHNYLHMKTRFMIKLGNRWIREKSPIAQANQGNMAVKPQIMGFDLHGRSRWLRVTAFPILDESSGTLISVHIIFEDVTPLVKAEESVRHSESRDRPPV